MTTIDRIMSKVNEQKFDSKYIDIDKIRQILEVELTAVKGVDEIVEKYSKSQGIVNVRELISDLKTLQPERDEVEKGGCKRCHGEILPHNIFCGPTCADLYERGK